MPMSPHFQVVELTFSAQLSPHCLLGPGTTLVPVPFDPMVTFYVPFYISVEIDHAIFGTPEKLDPIELLGGASDWRQLESF